MLLLLTAALLIQDAPPDPPEPPASPESPGLVDRLSALFGEDAAEGEPDAPAGVSFRMPNGRLIVVRAASVEEALNTLKKPLDGVSANELRERAAGDGPGAEEAAALLDRLAAGPSDAGGVRALNVRPIRVTAAMLPPDSPFLRPVPAPPKPPEPPKPPIKIEDLSGTLEQLRATIGAGDGTDGSVFLRDVRGAAGDPIRLSGDRVFVWDSAAPQAPAVPATGTLKLTAPDGTVTEYRAEFTPDPPAAAEPPPKGLLGVRIDGRAPTGDPPGLVIAGVLENSAAAEAGVENGDRVISIGGEPLKSFRVLRLKVDAAAEAAEPLVLKVVRGDAGKEKEKEGGDGEAPAARILRFELTPRPADAAGEVQDGGEEADMSVWLKDSVRWPYTIRDVANPPVRFRFGPATVRPAESAARDARVRAAAAAAAAARLGMGQILEANERQAGVVPELDVAGARAELARAEADLAAAEAAADRPAARPDAALAELRDQLAALREELNTLKADREQSETE